jgi:hypothetical protein
VSRLSNSMNSFRPSNEHGVRRKIYGRMRGNLNKGARGDEGGCGESQLA